MAAFSARSSAGKLAERGLVLADELELLGLRSHLLNTLGVCQVVLGDGDGGIARIQEALALGLEAGEPDAIGRAYVNLCDTRVKTGRFREAVAVAEEGRAAEQRLRALEQANEVRTARAKLKKELASGKIEPVQILADPPACVRTARVREVLLAVPKIGSVRAGRILAQCGIAHSKTLGGLTERQRDELIDLFCR